MSADLIIHILFRFIHIGSVIMFLGGVFYASQVLVPTFNLLPEDLRMQSAIAAQVRLCRPEAHRDLPNVVWDKNSAGCAYLCHSHPGSNFAIW